MRLFNFWQVPLPEVKEVSEVKEVNDVCFVCQEVIYTPHSGIVDNFDNFERSDNFRKLRTMIYQTAII